MAQEIIPGFDQRIQQPRLTGSDAAGILNNFLNGYVSPIINVVYVVIGAAAILTLIYAGIRYITAKGDPALLRQVLTNLISNAIKFSKPEGGTVTVRLTKKALSIQDTGIGIAQESLVHIFDRFYQAENSRTNDGYGLGLALVKRIIDLHRWTISAKSTLDKGTTFVIGIDS
jgi:signal transduction histidine kinase